MLCDWICLVSESSEKSILCSTLKEKAPFDWQQTFIHIKIRKCLQINHKAAARTQLLKTVTAHTAEVTLCDSGNNKTDFYCIMPGLFSLKIIKIWHIKANNTIYVCGSDSKTNLQIFSWFPLKILWLWSSIFFHFILFHDCWQFCWCILIML